MTKVSNRARAGAVALALGLLGAAGCGDDGEGTSDAAGATDAPDTGATADTASPVGSAGDDSGGILGPVDAAEGEPLRIGFISDGANAAADQSIELEVAEATAAYVNERRAGIAGRPIELVSCSTGADPAKGIDCANQMVEEGVPAVVVGASGVLEQVWQPLHDAGVPTIMFQASSTNILGDTETTFVFSDSAAGSVDIPITTAKDAGADQVTVIVIDVPPAVAVYEGENAERFADEGVELELVRVPPGTADMTPQLQDVVAGDPGLIHVVGNDGFCISAFQALNVLGFDGPLTAIPQCITDATRSGVPTEMLEGLVMASPAPIGVEDETTELYRAVVETYGSGIDTSRITGMAMFIAVAGLEVALDTIEGEITPQTVIDTLRAMPDMELPGSGGLHFRCNGNAARNPSACVRGILLATLGPDAHPASYEPSSTEPIED